MQFTNHIRVLLLAIVAIIDRADLAPPNHGSISSPTFEDQTQIPAETSTNLHQASAKRRTDYYEYRHVVAKGVQQALDECREKFKWDRWNCPKKIFLDILDRNKLPCNKELGLARAMISSNSVLALTTSCSYGTTDICGCSNAEADALSKIPTNRSPKSTEHAVTISAINHPNLNNKMENDGEISTSIYSPNQVEEFVWRGCDESVKSAFQVSKIFLEYQEINTEQDRASKRINAHNYEVGRMAVKRNMKKICKCHGVSGSCQVKTCWTTVPDMSQVGDYLKRLYRNAAKVGAMTAEETDIDNLNRELKKIGKDKLVFADASPDYCFENPKLGINGTLNRYCTPRLKGNSTYYSKDQKDSCERLCTGCGYKIKRERMKIERQCRCRFEFCCEVKCERCIVEEDVYRCVRHS